MDSTIIMMLVFSSIAYCNDPNLVAHWKFDETEDYEASDSSGNDNDGELAGGADWNEAGKVDGCIELDGDGDYVQVNDTNDPPIISKGSNFTISAWINLSQISGNHVIYGYHSASSSLHHAYSLKVKDGYISFSLHDDIPDPNYNQQVFGSLENGENIITNRWYYLTITCDGEYIRCYLDGIVRSKQAITLTGNYPEPGAVGDFYELIGGNYSGPWSNFNGRIDDLQVWLTCLSSDAIRDIYEAGFTEYSETIDVREYPYYADPNGITDASSAIQQAIDDTNSNGKTIWLGNGAYKISQTIYLKPFTKMQGDSAIIFNGGMSRESYSEAMLVVQDKCDVKNIVVDGDGENPNGILIEGYNVDITLENVFVHNFKGDQDDYLIYGIAIKNESDNIEVVDCIISNISTVGPETMGGGICCRGIMCYQVNDTLIEGCLFNNITSDSGYDAECIHVATSNDYYEDPNNAYYWEESDVAIQSCDFYDFSWRAVKLQCSGSSVNDCFISAVNPTTAIEIFGTGNSIERNSIFLDVPLVAGIVATCADDGFINENFVEILEVSEYAENKNHSMVGAGGDNTWGVYLYDTENMDIRENVIKQAGYGFVLKSDDAESNTYCSIQDNYIDTEIDFLDYSDPNSNNTFAPNVFRWDSDTLYYSNADPNMVLHDDNVYQCIQSHQNHEPPNTSYWSFVESIDFMVPKVHNVDSHIWYDTINDAIDDATNGDEIVVYPWTYEEHINFDGKAITVRSVDPNDWNIVAATIIDGGVYNPVLFMNGETTNSVITGLTITGSGNNSYGVYCIASSPTISKCIVEDNYYGIGWYIAPSSPVIINNIIRYNSYGLRCYDYQSPPVSSPIIKNNWIYDNVYYGIHAACQGTTIIQNNTIVDNGNSGIIRLYSCPVQISNCIIWGNGDDLKYCTATYSCIEDGDAGTGNISSDPCFVDAEYGDFHLDDDSPCIDVGDPNGVYTGWLDFDGDERVIDITGKGDDTVDIDMGADEYADDD